MLYTATKAIPRESYSSTDAVEDEHSNEKGGPLEASELLEEDYLLTPPRLYGFSLTKKTWS
jgi:hypothetical protein